MKLTLLLAMVLLVSCGGSSGPKKVSKQEQWADQIRQCGDTKTLCIPNAKWYVESSAVNFPEEFSLTVMGDLIFDSCGEVWTNMKPERRADKVILEFRYPYMDAGDLKISIIDRGVKCDNDAVFVHRDSATYSSSVFSTEDGKHYSVYVDLEN